MSAFVVSDNHINSLLSFVNRNSSFTLRAGGQDFQPVSVEHLQKMAEILYAQNLRSVSARYREDNGGAEDFRFRFVKTPVTAVQALKLCACYDYQACETDDYSESLAAKIVDAIRHVAISKLPGYDEAEWAI